MSVPDMFEIAHKCGHTGTRDLSDVAAGQRAGKAAWWSERPCFDCFKKSSNRKISKELQSERDALHQEAIADQERSGLPLLRGSDKQVSWAIDERFKLLRAAYEDLVQAGDMHEDDFESDILSLARRVDVAKWWIDNREATSEMMIELLADPGIEAGVNENPLLTCRPHKRRPRPNVMCSHSFWDVSTSRFCSRDMPRYAGTHLPKHFIPLSEHGASHLRQHQLRVRRSRARSRAGRGDAQVPQAGVLPAELGQGRRTRRRSGVDLDVTEHPGRISVRGRPEAEAEQGVGRGTRAALALAQGHGHHRREGSSQSARASRAVAPAPSRASITP